MPARDSRVGPRPTDILQGMSDDPRKRRALEHMVAIAEHMRDCARCRRVYGVAFDSALEAHGEAYANIYLAFPFAALQHCFRELRECENWPKER